MSEGLDHTIEHMILENLINNDAYFRKVIPHLKEEYFETKVDKTILKFIQNFAEKYNKSPNQKVLSLMCKEYTSFSQDEFVDAKECVESLSGIEENQDWLVERTESFCKDKSVYNAIMSAIHIIDGKDKDLSAGAIPSLLQDALAVSFDKNIGHSLFDDAEARYEYYHAKEERIPFHLSYFNKITKGGLPKKTLSVILAGCVHPDTKIKIRITKSKGYWEELEVNISNIQNLLNDYDIEVSSPDGWVSVTKFVDKGMWQEYVLIVGDKTVRCNENHLFETNLGWMFVTDIMYYMINDVMIYVLSDNGEYANVTDCYGTGQLIPIVDIQVNHANHRYYTNGISSHNTGVGKSFFMCDHAANAVKMGYNALYLTMELAAERVAERIDCNLLDVTIDDLFKIDKNRFLTGIKGVESKSHGKLIIKEYPTGGGNVALFRLLLDDLLLKQNFKPDIIYVDYINICSSVKFKSGGNHNTYTIVKSISEELRGLAVEYNLPILSATQATRGGNNNSDIELVDTSESIGLPQTVDLLFGIMRTEELDKIGQIIVKQLKSRMGDINYYRKFLIGCDISKFKMFDIEESQQGYLDGAGTTDKDKPLFDSSKKAYDFSGLDFD